MVIAPNLLAERRPLAMKARLSSIAKSHTLRCDVKQSERRFSDFDRFMSSVEHFYLGEVLPKPIIKGSQPRYLESVDEDGVPVISTLAIQQLEIRRETCRLISYEDFEALEPSRTPQAGDVLLTVDGGTSIGKPALFNLEDDYAIDSHVAILRPVGLDPRFLVYLLASPLGQVQFHRAESGASGQTAVTEDDIRRFRFPVVDHDRIRAIVDDLEQQRASIADLMNQVARRQQEAWDAFDQAVMGCDEAAEVPGTVAALHVVGLRRI